MVLPQLACLSVVVQFHTALYSKHTAISGFQTSTKFVSITPLMLEKEKHIRLHKNLFYITIRFNENVLRLQKSDPHNISVHKLLFTLYWTFLNWSVFA